MLLSLIQIIGTAFEDIYRKYKNYMYKIAFDIMQDNYLAEDVVQGAMFRINSNLHKIDDIDSKRTKNFIITITRNVAFTALKKEKNTSENVQFIDEDEFNSVVGDVDVDAFCHKNGFGDEIFDALSSLGEVDKDIILLRYGMDYTCKEIAKILNMSEDSVYKRCQRARNSLRKRGEKRNDIPQK